MDGYYESRRDHLKHPMIWKSQNINFVPHFHRTIEITYVVKGEIQCICNGKNYCAKANEILIFPSYSVHSGTSTDGTETMVILAPLDYSSAIFSSLSGKTFQKLIVTSPEACGEIYDAMRRLLEHKGKKVSANITKGYVSVIVGLLTDAVGLCELEKDKNDYLSKDILMYLQKNFLSPISLDEISAKFGYSKYSFSHLFNSYFQCSMTEYINSLRARYAANLLMETKVSMTEIAMQSGFESLRTFYRVFKKDYGETPSEYKKQRHTTLE